MNLCLPSDNAGSKVTLAVYFGNRAETDRLQHNTNPGMIY